MKSIPLLGYLVLLGSVGIAGCGGNSDPSTADQYPVKGKIVSIDRTASTITIEHQDIPGLMTAAKTQFTVQDRKVLEGLHSGDWVVGQLKAEAGMNVVIELRKW